VATPERTEELLKGLHDAVVEFEEEKTAELSKAAVEEGIDAYDAIMKGLAWGMETVGDLYARQEYFVPELLLCADALYAGLEVLRPHLKESDTAETGKKKIILGVVEGVGLSALMTTSMLAMPRIIKMVKSQNPGVAVMVGGAPITREIATSYGADGYADNAGEAVAEADRILKTVRDS